MSSTTPRERLYDVFSDTEGSVEDKINHALAVGTNYFELPIGFVTRISEGRQAIVCATGGHHLIQPGESCPLEDAYCRQTIEIDGVLAVHDVQESAIPQDAIDAFDLGTYIGTKIIVNGQLFGTVCFADEDHRDRSFSSSQELFLELLANLISNALERQEYEQKLVGWNEALKQERERFEGIAENSVDILFRIGRDARFTYVSSAVERILSYDPEELVGEPMYDFMCPNSTDAVSTAYSKLLSGEDVKQLEISMQDSSGNVVILEVNATPLTNGDEIVGVQGVGRDITARKERQQELQMKTRAMDEAAVGISIADPNRPDEPLIYVNDAFERITGYSADATVGRNCRFLQGEETDPDAIAKFREAIETETAATVELINYQRDGTPFWNRVQLNPVFDDDGELLHYLGFQNDVTERKRTEQLIRLLNRVLRHNLRNDMNKISGWAHAIGTGEVDDTRDAGSRIERISDNLTQLTTHARELENYARGDRAPKRLDTVRMLEDLTDTFSRQFPDAEITTSVDSQRDICAGAELEAALSELLENALKHNPESHRRLNITVRDDNEWVEIAVTDNGPGINETETKVVTAGTETALEHASGLGLWLVNWIVTRYGGSFQIATRGENGTQGTTAIVRLPAIGANQLIDDVDKGPTVLFR